MTEMMKESLRDIIIEANATFVALFKKGDAAALAQLYTEDGKVLPTGADILSGRTAIEQFWKAVMDMGIKGAALETIEVDHCGETAVEMGHYQMLGSEGQVLDTGKYIVVWKHERGAWKLHRDIFNTSLPAK